MKAPDIIYMPPHEIRDRGEFLAIECKNDIPYIRKDALLKLLDTEKQRHAGRESIEGIAACHALNDLIEKLESL